MTKNSCIILLFCVLVQQVSAQSTHWRIEAESAQTRVLQRGDTLDITSPQGLSLWWDEPIEAPCTIEYKACVVVEGGPCDRLSDLNCFWMASEGVGEAPQRSEGAIQAAVSPLRGIVQRGGRFSESYRLQCYYVGFGGNHNTTTRLRRYEADTLGITDPQHRPAIIREYTDAAHLLRPNHWYAVRLEVKLESSGARVSYTIDGERLFDYLDPHPILRGWFAFRTTWSHTRLTAFRVTKQR